MGRDRFNDDDYQQRGRRPDQGRRPTGPPVPRGTPEQVGLTGRISRIMPSVQGKAGGFGFIRAEDGREFFFHRTICVTPFDDLREGDSVIFDFVRSEKGPRAQDVTRAEVSS